MRIVHVSDTHCHVIKNMPKADLLVHSGDATYNGTVHEVKVFNDWLGFIKHKYKEIIFVPGNHDWLFQHNEELAREMMTNARVLINESYEFEGYKIYGSPNTPQWGYWAFMKLRGEEMAHVWNKIPEDTNVLISHGPPKGMMDEVWSDMVFRRVGCDDLAERIKSLNKLQLHMFGHIHPGYGKERRSRILYSNGSIMQPHGIGYNPPLEILLEPPLK